MSKTIVIDARRLPGEIIKKRLELAQGLGRSIRRGAMLGRAVLVRRTPKDTGLLKAAWRNPETITEGVQVVNDMPYAGIVEHGARPHPVSEAGQLAIYEWVRRHFGFLRAGRGRKAKVVAVPLGSHVPGRVQKRLRGKLGEFEMSAELVKIAQGIINKLRTKGQAPTFFVKDSLPDLQRITRREVVREVRRIAEQGAAK